MMTEWNQMMMTLIVDKKQVCLKVMEMIQVQMLMNQKRGMTASFMATLDGNILVKINMSRYFLSKFFIFFQG